MSWSSLRVYHYSIFKTLSYNYSFKYTFEYTQCKYFCCGSLCLLKKLFACVISADSKLLDPILSESSQVLRMLFITNWLGITYFLIIEIVHKFVRFPCCIWNVLFLRFTQETACHCKYSARIRDEISVVQKFPVAEEEERQCKTYTTKFC